MEELQKELKLKFFELSELFTKVNNNINIDPEQKCSIISSMLDIYVTLKSY